MAEKNTALIIGVGNELRGDDAAGRAVARLIRAQELPLRVVEEAGDGVTLMTLWQSPAGQAVYLIDAMVSGQTPGSVQRIDALAETLPVQFRSVSAHLFSLAQAVELARALGELPPQLIIYGIEGKCFDFGAGLSPEVEAGVRQAAERIIAECLG